MLVYRLYAVVFHAGYYANSGHYKCVVRRDKQWLGFDDDEVPSSAAHCAGLTDALQVTALSESEISSLFPEDGEGSSTAYILFYHLYDPTRDNAAAVSAAELLSSLAPGSVVMAEPHHGDEAHVQSLLNELNAEESASNRPPPPPASAANRTTLPPPLPSVPEPPPPDLSLPATLDPDAPVDLPPLPRLPSQTDALMRDVSDVMDTSSVRTHATQDSTSDRMQL